MRRAARLLAPVLSACLAWPAAAANAPAVTNPASLGLDATRLDRFGPLIEQRLREHRLAGAVLMIARDGKVAYARNYGVADEASGRTMTPDTIFRIYSMTKPIVAVAAMMLYEQGKFDLRDPVSDYIPEFAHMKVQVTGRNAAGHLVTRLVPAERPITVLDLMRHTSGLGYFFTKSADGTPYYKHYGIDSAETTLDLAGFVHRLAAVPLVNQPGSVFYYSYGIDVLGRLIEIWSGKTLDRYLAEAVFAPLGMTDTGFFVPPEKLGRLATLYTPDPPAKPDAEGIAPLGGPIVRVPGGKGPQDSFSHKPTLFSGGGGLVSTPQDYTRFAMMLAEGGALNGVRLLSPKTVALIGSDVLGDIPRGPGAPWKGDGFGLTVEVSKGPGATATLSSAGEFDWGGLASTDFFVDPQTHLVGVLMMQVIPGASYWGRMLRQVATQAVVAQ
jgi:CubicO group peptidase (beta-lactamase class C family)